MTTRKEDYEVIGVELVITNNFYKTLVVNLGKSCTWS
jgi:hypothetical protein